MPSTGLAYYAKFGLKQYTLTLSLDGGTSTHGSSVTQYYGTTLEIQDPTKSGYRFDGWTNTSGGANWNSSTKVYTFNANGTITANWVQQYIVILDMSPYAGYTSDGWTLSYDPSAHFSKTFDNGSTLGTLPTPIPH